MKIGDLLGEHAIRLLNYVDGDLLTSTTASPQLIRKVGEYLAKVHLALKVSGKSRLIESRLFLLVIFHNLPHRLAVSLH